MSATVSAIVPAPESILSDDHHRHDRGQNDDDRYEQNVSSVGERHKDEAIAIVPDGRIHRFSLPV
jgi:hypothetical protein